ncbi:MAG: hypothetical protein LBJ35_04955 [Spirochaetaceae bacterium]|jgi:hypothetical protein|nr:hypothetical protein [Spirochaetaceae bacterium]
MKKIYTATFILFIALAYLNAQDEKSVFKIQPLVAEGSSPEEIRLLEALIYSYFSDKQDVIILPPDDIAFTDNIANDVAGEPPDYFVKSSLYPENDICVFELVVSDINATELSRQTAKYKTTKDIALNLHNIINAAFEWRGDINEAPEAPDAELIIPEKIFGLWRGDTGIKLVRILPDGKAFAFFASGVNMMLSYKIENNTLNVKQVSPNNENFYYPLPLPIAKVLAQESEPMQWEFMLYENENLLKGSRIETTVEFEDYEKIVIRHNSVRQSEWNKLPR